MIGLSATMESRALHGSTNEGGTDAPEDADRSDRSSTSGPPNAGAMDAEERIRSIPIIRSIRIPFVRGIVHGALAFVHARLDWTLP